MRLQESNIITSVSGDVSIDVGSALPYYTEQLLKLFGQDFATKEANKELSRQQVAAAEHASFVQCIGMACPIPIQNIYQSTKLVMSHDERG